MIGGEQMNLSRIERETIITYNAEEDVACCYTTDKSTMRKLQKLIDAEENVKVLRQNEEMVEIEVPKKWVKVRPPRKVSENAKAKAGERMRSYWESKDKHATEGES